jgi:hypothetical protein
LKKKVANCLKLILIIISKTGEEVDHEEVDGLYQDATTPIEAVMAQTGVTGETDNSKPSSSQPVGNGTSTGNEFFNSSLTKSIPV